MIKSTLYFVCREVSLIQIISAHPPELINVADSHHSLTGHSCYENMVARIPSLFHRHVTPVYQLIKKHSS